MADEWKDCGMEHVGSTAVPGMSAKPVIDVIFDVRSLENSRPAIDVLAEYGCEYPSTLMERREAS